MTADHFEHALVTFRERTPFRPSTVALQSGKQFAVDHPGAMVRREGVAIFVGPGGVPVAFDHEGG